MPTLTVVSPFATACASEPVQCRQPQQQQTEAADTAANDGQQHPPQQRQHSLRSSWQVMGLRVRSALSHSLSPQVARHVSEVPGPAYPFPSATAAAAGQLPAHADWRDKTLKPYRRFRARSAKFTLLDWLQLLLPCVKWLRTYRVKEFLLWDVVAGVSVAFMLVPQGMSYANIAGLPSVYGLYGGFTPALVYALFGSSRELAVGPVAVTSLLISASLKNLVPGSAGITNPGNPSPEHVAVQAMYNVRAIQLSLLVACMYTAVGLLNLGFLTNFLSHSVINGFTSGAAIIISLSQLKYLLGFNVPRSDRLHELLRLYIEGMHGFVWQECVMGVTSLTILLTIRFFGQRHARLKWLRPLGPISVCIIGIIAVVAGGLQDRGIKIVGAIPAGLPSPTVSWWLPMADFARLAPLAVVVMLVDLLESTSIVRALAAKRGYELRPNQEIVGLGLANFAGSMFNAYSTTGSFSRSAVNFDSGCKTPLSGFVTGCVVGLVLLFMTPVFSKLPLSVMGAIVISGVSGLFEYEEAVRLFRVRKLDWAVWMAAFLGTLFLSVEIGLAISIGLALLITVYESAFCHTALLGRVGRTTIYRNVKQFSGSQVIPGIAACRVDAPMYFANVQHVHERLRKYVARARAYSEAAGVPLQYLLLDMSPVTHLDSTGAHLLEKLHAELVSQGVQLGLCNPACAVIALLERTGFPEQLGRQWFFVRMHDAVQTCLASMLAAGQAVRPLTASTSGALAADAPGMPAGAAPRAVSAAAGRPPLVRQSAPGAMSLAAMLPSRAGSQTLAAGDRPGMLRRLQQGSASKHGDGSASPLLAPAALGSPDVADGGGAPAPWFGDPDKALRPTAGAAAATGVVVVGSCDSSVGGSDSSSASSSREGAPHVAGAAPDPAGSAAVAPADHMDPGAADPRATQPSRDSATGGGMQASSASSGAASQLPPPASLAGLQLHIPPAVLQHPAVASRAGSGAGRQLSSGGGSLPRPVSPHTEQLLDGVFTASNGDAGDVLAASLLVEGDTEADVAA